MSNVDVDHHIGCIDKSSSAELSEAINSMFGWYKRAVKCYAYLNDCRIPSTPERDAMIENSAVVNDFPERHSRYVPWNLPRTNAQACICMTVEKVQEQYQRDYMYDLIGDCRWFTRGWTLQELIAPKSLWFFDRHWQTIARRREILLTLEALTGIHKEALEPSLFCKVPILSHFSVAQRMHWASSRRTTRKEDEAYCLLGIFGINMSLLYGEGNRAFKRLQEEIMRTTADQSILAWEPPGDRFSVDPDLLAASASCFEGAARNIIWEGSRELSQGSEFRLTHQGLEIELWIDKYRVQNNCSTQVAGLDCVFKQPGGHSHRVGLLLQGPRSESDRWQSDFGGPCPTRILLSPAEKRTMERRLLKLPLSWASRQRLKRKLLIANDNGWDQEYIHDVQIQMDFLQRQEIYSSAWRVLAAYPRFQWSERSCTLMLPRISNAYGGIAVNSIEYGTVFIILGLATGFHGSTRNAPPFHGFCKYWIVNEPGIGVEAQERSLALSKDDENAVGIPTKALALSCVLERCEFYLEKLCEHASTFAAKDHFEGSTRRNDSHKSVVLPDSKVLRAFLSENMVPYHSGDRQMASLRLHTQQNSREWATLPEEDYFRLRDIDQLFFAKLAEQRRRSLTSQSSESLYSV